MRGLPEQSQRGAVQLELREDALDETGSFEGYLVLWDTPDLRGEIWKKGAFKEDLKKRGNTKPLLWQHDTWKPIGVYTAMEDDKGLLIRGTINQEVQAGREATSLLKQGAIRGLSVGFVPLSENETREGTLVLKAELWEGSLVTFPRQPAAQVMAVREAWSGIQHVHRNDESGDEEAAEELVIREQIAAEVASANTRMAVADFNRRAAKP